MSSKTLMQLDVDLQRLQNYHDQLVTSLSKVNEEIHLLEEEKRNLLDHHVEQIHDLDSAVSAACLLGLNKDLLSGES